MAMGRWTGLVQDAFGNAVAGALVEVRRESNGTLVPLFSDREGTIGLANPFTATEATIFFHAAGGAYRVTAIKGGLQQIWRYVAVGTAGETDIESLEQRIDDGLAGAVLTIEQELSPGQQEQALENLDPQLSSLIRQNSRSAAYALVLTDGAKHILHPSSDATARTWTIPANASVAFPIGTAITFVNQNGAGLITIACGDTMRLAGPGTTGNRTLAANGVATAIKITATEWIISGTGLY